MKSWATGAFSHEKACTKESLRPCSSSQYWERLLRTHVGMSVPEHTVPMRSSWLCSFSRLARRRLVWEALRSVCMKTMLFKWGATSEGGAATAPMGWALRKQKQPQRISERHSLIPRATNYG